MKLFSRIIILCIIISNAVFAQDEYSTHIQCYGNIPDEYLTDISEYIKVQEQQYEDFFDDDNELNQIKENLIIFSSFSHHFYFENGKVLFGDDISNYLEKIKAIVLESYPSLATKIKVSTIVSSEVNAYSTLEGNIFFSLGLLARLENEAQLAFIMSHEIAHYHLKHVMENVKLEGEIKAMKKKRKFLSIDDVMGLKMKRSRQHEYEADSMGYVLFSKTPYAQKEAISVLRLLAKSHLPTHNDPFDYNFFNMDYLIIPDCFHIDEVQDFKLTAHNDVLHTHPDITKRITRVKNLPGFSLKTGKKYVQDDSIFKLMTKTSSFALIQPLLTNRDYGEAIYTAYCLLKQAPDNIGLHLAFAKALYGLTKYKNNQYFHCAAPSYTKVQEESQALHYMLKHLTAKQLNVIAVKFIHKMAEKYPHLNYLRAIKKDLIEQLVIKHKLSLDDFYTESIARQKIKVHTASVSDSQNLSKNAQRSKNKDFYKFAFVHERENEEFKKLFEQGQKTYQEIQKRKNTPYKERMKIDQAEQQRKEQFGYGINAQKILLYEPHYFRIIKNDLRESIEETFNDKQKMVESLKHIGKVDNANVSVISVSDLKKSNVTEYNDFCDLTKWVIERGSHVNSVNIVPVNIDIIERNNHLKGFDIVVTTDIIVLENKKTRYFFTAYDIKSGKCVYKNEVSTKKTKLTEIINKLMLEDLEKLTH